MLEIILILLWVPGGAVTAKKAIAKAEQHYLRLAAKADRPQNKMDADDWCGAITFAAASAVAFPVVALVWILSFPARWLYIPVRSYMLPPVQEQFEGHVRDLNAQKALVLSTWETFRDVSGWEPDDAGKTAMLASLKDQIEVQYSELLRMIDPSNPTGFDGNFLDTAKDEIKAITQGSAA